MLFVCVQLASRYTPICLAANRCISIASARPKERDAKLWESDYCKTYPSKLHATPYFCYQLSALLKSLAEFFDTTTDVRRCVSYSASYGF